MTGRSKTGGFSEDLARAPGPGAYQHVRPDVTKRKAPGYSMLGRSYMPGGLFQNILECLILSYWTAESCASYGIDCSLRCYLEQ